LLISSGEEWEIKDLLETATVKDLKRAFLRKQEEMQKSNHQEVQARSNLFKDWMPNKILLKDVVQRYGNTLLIRFNLTLFTFFA
jgi:hypothetical protein